jgi:hypothetical protein
MRKRLIVTHFNKDAATVKVEGEKIYYPKNSIGLLPNNITKDIIDNKTAKAYFIDEFITTFDYVVDHHEKTRLFAHMAQGIGDIIAFSAITEFLRDYRPIQIHVNPGMNCIFDWFKFPQPELRNFYAPICEDFTPTNRLTKYKHLRRINIEYTANEAGSKNWIEAYFERIGIPFPTNEMLRPELNDSLLRYDTGRRIDNLGKILICHKSSCMIRTSKFEDFYHAAKEAYPYNGIAVHAANLSQEDWEFIKTLDDKPKIIAKGSLKEYLEDIFDAKMVISTDTAAIHLREGVHKPAIGVYGAFTKESRTEHYLYTKSFNTKSDCEFQPCFKHEEIPGEYCMKVQKMKEYGFDINTNVAPCQSGENFQQQLTQFLKDNRI